MFKPKLFTLLKSGITKEQLRNDLFAGIIVGIVALPLAIAFSVASGVSPQMGIISAIVAGFIVSLLGGSRVQIAGPTGAFVVILYALVQKYGLEGLMISTIMAGFILVAFGLLGLGSLLRFIPHPLIIGFTSAIALIIFTSQIKDALGLDVAKMPSEFLDKWLLYFELLSHINAYALLITTLTIIITTNTKYLSIKIPGSFIAVMLLTPLVSIFELPVATIETFFGEIPSSFNFTLPHIELSSIGLYIVPALTIALLGGIESLLSAVVADGMIGSTHRSNTELIAQGVANIVTPFFGGIAATGAIARTATNIKNGGRSPIAGIVHSITLLFIMLFFANYAKLIPMSVLAGILMVVAYNMSEYKNFLSILKGSKFDVMVLLSTFFLTILVNLTVAIEVGIVLSSLLFMKRMADIETSKIPKELDSDAIENYANVPEHISIYEINGPMFFASAKQYAQTIKDIGLNSKIIIIRMRHVPFVDTTALHNFEAAIDAIMLGGTRVIISGIQDGVYKDIKKYGLVKLLGEQNIHKTFDKALAFAKTLPDD